MAAAWNSYSGSSKILVVVHEQGVYRGWKSFTKVDGKTMYQYLQGGDNTVLGKTVLNSSVASLSSKERLVRLSSALYANHCRDIYGTGCTTTGVSYGPEAIKIRHAQTIRPTTPNLQIVLLRSPVRSTCRRR